MSFKADLAFSFQFKSAWQALPECLEAPGPRDDGSGQRCEDGPWELEGRLSGWRRAERENWDRRGSSSGNNNRKDPLFGHSQSGGRGGARG